MNLLLHPEVNAGISINECKLLSSFPKDYKMLGTYQEQWARLGNSVMPKFMQAIAENIRDNILERMSDIGIEPKLIK